MKSAFVLSNHRKIASLESETEIPSSASSVVQIDLAAIQSNYHFVKQKMGPRRVTAAVVKADAYGLGMIPVAQALYRAGARHFFVATLDEGMALRQSMQSVQIFVLNGLWSGVCDLYTRFQLTPVLNDIGQVTLWRDEAHRLETQNPLPAILQVETGLVRLGLNWADVLKVVQDSDYFHGISIQYIMSHLACAYIPDHPYNDAQYKLFSQFQKLMPQIPASFVGSGGLFRESEDYLFDMVRPGRILYGSTFTSKNEEMKRHIQSVVHWKARILQVQNVEAGQSVGYDHTYQAREPLKIATVCAGYADGYMRSLSNSGRAMIGKFAIPVIGRVSMDMLTLDVTNVPEQLVHPGAWVDLMNQTITIDDMAESAGTISWEILTRLGPRPHRQYISNV